MSEKVLHPLRGAPTAYHTTEAARDAGLLGSEDERVMTREQRNALEELALSCDEMSAVEWGEHGSIVVRTYSYDEAGGRVATPHTISRAGIPT